ncbi:response regulator [Aestuariispira insulae]|uniref:Response regulator receiver domain-containing protein n=1 Tax=Aestuariispira insulae TaxID=1461337 RepID=A0A3D9HXV5_9PROT|nr:response regulator [Aestuariispira insulae]RED54245.1 response regulator receiver domain-containing protein [Aestuariispira insulae]
MSLDLSNHAILIADDEKFTLQTVMRMLEDLNGPEITAVENGAVALAHMRSTDKLIDLIISDFDMPETNGLELLKAVRSGAAGIDRATPFAMLTGKADQDLVDDALALDVSAFLIKPITSSKLQSRLQRILDTRDDTGWLLPGPVYDAIGLGSSVSSSFPLELAPQGGDFLTDLDKSDSTETLCAFHTIPDNAVLARDLKTKDGAIFIKKGITITHLIALVLSYLYKDNILLPHRDHQGNYGLFVRAPGSDKPDAGIASSNEEVFEKAPEEKETDIYSVSEGNIISRDIMTNRGRLYLGEGTELSPKMITMLRDLHKVGKIEESLWVRASGD